MEHPADILTRLAKANSYEVTDDGFAKFMDANDELAHLRKQFYMPTVTELLEESKLVDGPAPGVDPLAECIYFAAQSLGLQPVGAKQLVDEEMDKWRTRGQYARDTGARPWVPIEDTVQKQIAKLVGATNPSLEIAIMNGLTINIHIGLTAFYQPTATRNKILLEDGAFPSDHYSVESQIKLRGYDPASCMVIVKPREGEETLRTEDIVAKIMEEGDSIALVYLPGIQFLTGQLFDIKTITEAAHKKGCYVGIDLAHAVGNVDLHLTDWEVDFACWCHYKYVCASPAGIAGFFLHQKHAYNFSLPRMVGWWAHERSTRFDMDNCLKLQPGAAGFTMTTTPTLDIVTLLASLNVFETTSMASIRKRSVLLTGYFELLLKQLTPERSDDGQPDAKKRKTFQIQQVTPSDPEQRGSCLSFRVSCSGDELVKRMLQRGIAMQCHRGIIRSTPSPLYGQFIDVWLVYRNLMEVIEEMT